MLLIAPDLPECRACDRYSGYRHDPGISRPRLVRLCLQTVGVRARTPLTAPRSVRVSDAIHFVHLPAQCPKRAVVSVESRADYARQLVACSPVLAVYSGPKN